MQNVFNSYKCYFIYLVFNMQFQEIVDWSNNIMIEIRQYILYTTTHTDLILVADATLLPVVMHMMK